jgi:AbrB family looped-hinge helix DNA binding protein
MPEFESKIDRRGRVALPPAVRRALGLERGGRLVWRLLGDGRVLLSNASADDPASVAPSWCENDPCVVPFAEF